MLAAELIRAKRDAHALSPEDIKTFVAGFADGAVSDAQVAAFAMAVYFNGMEGGETVALTEAMRDSGTVLDWSDLGRPVLDKHSTGGVGDNVSLMLAPILAACGAAVPMISGRGLGHTGGTLDKLEAIPGYRVAPSLDVFRAAVREAGCAIVGQSADLAPADKRFYAVRDVTATVESRPLIVASILSKKLAAGLGSLVLDVKTGSGAFMASEAAARALAEALVTVANGAGLKTSALVTGMDEPLAPCAGNAIEVRAAVDFLGDADRDPAVEAVVLALAAESLALAGMAGSRDEGRAKARAVLDEGRALQAFATMVTALGGPADFVERMDAHLDKAPVMRDVPAPRDGTLAAIDTRALGMAVVELGGGRRRAEDVVDPRVGLSAIARLGTRLERDAPLARVHARDEASAERAIRTIQTAVTIGPEAPLRRSRIVDRIGPPEEA